MHGNVINGYKIIIELKMLLNIELLVSMSTKHIVCNNYG